MKTTIEINDELLREAKRTAAERETTLRELVETGLRREVQIDRDVAFVLRDGSFEGKGVTPEFRDAEWSKFREAAYEDRGA